MRPTPPLPKPQTISHLQHENSHSSFWHTSFDDVFCLVRNSTSVPIGNWNKNHCKYQNLFLGWKKWKHFQPFKSIRFYLNFHIDIHNTQSSLEQYRWWRGTTSGSSTAQQHSKTTCLLMDFISTIIDQYRHSPLSIFTATISVMKGHNIWLKHYTKTR